MQAVVYYREPTLYSGRYTHELKNEAGGIEIRQKRVALINCDTSHKSLLI
jgi:hypothetical protein